jgi:Memo-like protein
MSKSPVLKAVFAGSCYPRGAPAILEQFDKAIQLVKLHNGKCSKAPAYLVPHIDFRVNLNIYAQIYRMISERAVFPELFVILGVGHQCPHDFSLSAYDFSTPLGKVTSDSERIRKIQKDCPFPIALSPETFRGEHSLEFVISSSGSRQFETYTSPIGPLRYFRYWSEDFMIRSEEVNCPRRTQTFFNLGKLLKNTCRLKVRSC